MTTDMMNVTSIDQAIAAAGNMARSTSGIITQTLTSKASTTPLTSTSTSSSSSLSTTSNLHTITTQLAKATTSSIQDITSTISSTISSTASSNDVLSSVVTALTYETSVTSTDTTIVTSDSLLTSATIVTSDSLLTNATIVTGNLSSNISEDERLVYLNYLQSQSHKAIIPSLVYLTLLSLVGIIGNCLVIFVYSKKFRSTSTRIFILAIAVLDMVTNVVVIPGEIYDLFYLWTFDQPIICKVRLYFNAFTTMASAILLVAVAIVRYRKICMPFRKQVSIRLARILTVAIVLISVIFSVPYAIINGRQTKATPRAHEGIYGSECTIDDSYKDTIWPMVNSGFFILLFFSTCIPLVIMYICIGVKAWKHSKVYGVATYSKGGQDTTTYNSSTVDTGTKSTEEVSVFFRKSTRTKSYTKKKKDDSSDDTQVTIISKGTKGKDNGKKTKNSGHDVANGAAAETDDDNVIQYLTTDDDDDDDKPGKSSRSNNNNNYSARMMRAPVGDNAQINLCMVRELTVKLRAVQKEVEQRGGDEDEDDNDGDKSERKGESNNISVDRESKTVKFKDASNVSIDSNARRDAEMENGVGYLGDMKKNNQGEKTFTCSGRSNRHSKSMNDITILTKKEENEMKKRSQKPKAAENEDLDLRRSSTENKELGNKGENNEEEPKNEEPMTDFARAMQWVDITYCLNDPKRDSRKMSNDAGDDKDKEPGNLSKKSSFSFSRKVSRDNSFLQRHRTLRDALTDTLTRARKNKKEKDTTQAQSDNGNEDVLGDLVDKGSDKILENKNNDTEHVDKPNGKTSCQKQDYSKTSDIKGKNTLGKVKEENTAQTGRVRRRGLGHTTCMLICISAIYILGFLPFLALMFTKAASPSIFSSLDLVTESLYFLFLRSYFVNCAANPIVYSLCDTNFRRECYSLLCCGGRRRN